MHSAYNKIDILVKCKFTHHRGNITWQSILKYNLNRFKIIKTDVGGVRVCYIIYYIKAMLGKTHFVFTKVWLGYNSLKNSCVDVPFMCVLHFSILNLFVKVFMLIPKQPYISQPTHNILKFVIFINKFSVALSVYILYDKKL